MLGLPAKHRYVLFGQWTKRWMIWNMCVDMESKMIIHKWQFI